MLAIIISYPLLLLYFDKRLFTSQGNVSSLLGRCASDCARWRPDGCIAQSIALLQEGLRPPHGCYLSFRKVSVRIWAVCRWQMAMAAASAASSGRGTDGSFSRMRTISPTWSLAALP